MNKKIWQVLEKSGIRESGAVRWDPGLAPFSPRNRGKLPENAAGILCCLFPYYSKALERPGNISVYAAVPDYHDIAGEMLKEACSHLEEAFPGFSFVPFVDSSPLNEVTVAVRAGLGVRGLNRLLIHPVYGTYSFIGCIVTDMEVEPSQPGGSETCIRCGACVRACPGGAIGEDGIQKEKCLSHITQRKGRLEEWERRLIRQSGSAWGCDICQLACPLNREKAETHILAFRENILTGITKDTIMDHMHGRAFAFRGPGVLQRNVEILEEDE